MSIQLVVLYNDHTTMYFQVPEGQGWHIDSATRQIIVGKGLPRTVIPLDQVRSYIVEEIR